MCLRSAFAAVQWAPPDALAASVPAALDDENSWDDPEALKLTCQIKGDPEGPICGCTFKTRAALVAHACQSRQPGHGGHSMFHALTPRNACVNCGTTCQTKAETSRHLARAWHAGR
eukprot:558535-Pyramimonas_sp.AAC.1